MKHAIEVTRSRTTHCLGGFRVGVAGAKGLITLRWFGIIRPDKSFFSRLAGFSINYLTKMLTYGYAIFTNHHKDDHSRFSSII